MACEANPQIQITCGGAIGNDWSEHCWASAVDTNGMSGRPVVAPDLSLQLRISATEVRNTADVPTAATSFSQAEISAFVVSFGLSFES